MLCGLGHMYMYMNRGTSMYLSEATSVQFTHVDFVSMYYDDTANMCTDLIGLIDY